jgi:hypothetical protein
MPCTNIRKISHSVRVAVHILNAAELTHFPVVGRAEEGNRQPSIRTNPEPL